MNFYAEDKIREIERDLAFRDRNRIFLEEPKPRRRPLIGGVVATVGRALQRTGSGLEGWAAAAPSEDQPLARRAAR